MKSFFLAMSLTLVSLFSQACQAQLVMTLRGTPGSSVLSFNLSGSDVAQGGIANPISGAVFTITDGFDPFPAAINAGLGPTDIATFPIITGGAAMNVTNSGGDFGIAVDDLILEDSSFRGTERFGVLPVVTYDLMFGDTLSWNGAGTIDLSSQGLTFDDLSMGTGESVGGFVVGGIEATLHVVPEPSSLFLLLFAPVLAASRYRVG